jgi:nicotinamidase/pyrazinamidase
MPKKVLIIVDMQNDFCPGGALATNGADDIVPLINQLIERGGYDLVVATKDWHPADHVSFLPEQIGVAHCVQNTHGADLHPLLNKAGIHFVIHKGENPAIDCNSGFRDNNHQQSTGLEKLIREQVGDDAEIHICGVSTSKCVRMTAIDARELLPKATVKLVEDACRGNRPERVIQAKREMELAGVMMVGAKDVCQSINAVESNKR